MSRPTRRFRAYLALLLAAGLVVVAVAGWTLWVLAGERDPATFRNPSASMDSTLLAGDRFIVSKFAGASDAAARARRDMIVTHRYPPDESKVFVKRIVGMPGDTLAMVAGVLQRDGRVVREPWAWHAEKIGEQSGTMTDWGPFVVPPAHYFVLGDNRDHALDGRMFGFVSAAQLHGEVRRVYFSRDPASGAIRLSRFGTVPR